MLVCLHNIGVEIGESRGSQVFDLKQVAMSAESNQSPDNIASTYDGMKAYLSHFGIDHDKLVSTSREVLPVEPSTKTTELQQNQIRTMERICETLQTRTAGVKLESPSRKDMQMVVLLERIKTPEPFPNMFKVKTEDDPEGEADNRNFCRCCFKSMNPQEIQFEANKTSLDAFEEVTQVRTNHYCVAPTFCEACYQVIKSFVDFKKRAVKRQQRFEALVSLDDSLSSNISSKPSWDPLNDPPCEALVCEIKSEPFDEDLYYQECINQDTIPYLEVISKIPEPKTTRIKKSKRETNQKRPRRPTRKIPFTCDICGHSSLNKQHFDGHMQNWHFKQVINCNQCMYETTSPLRLRYHIRTKHEGKKVNLKPVETIACPICKNFVKSTNMPAHIARVHEKIKKFSCDQCGKMFFDRSGLMGHIDIWHTEVKLHVCEICGKSCHNAKFLRRHLKTHSDSYVSCDVCNRKFKEANQLKKHREVVHLNIKNHACNQCDRKFRSFSDFRNHQLNHMGVKYCCYIPGCSSAVARKDAMITHLKQSHSLSNEEMDEYRARLDEFQKESLKKLDFQVGK